ncbi:hypothetical protein BDR06DRAFT_1009967 [Suillus hirtellus]|nr:hypothetical protein BDR06DRAFT_1009967 [Suillus hirtellus]
MSIAPSLDAFPEDLQKGPSSGALEHEPMPLHNSSHNSREESSISPSASSASSASPHLLLPLLPLEATSAPLLNLMSQAPVRGDDSSFSAIPHPSQYPHTPQSPAEPCGKICVNKKIYTIQKILFTTKGLVGCGTVCYLVSLDKQEFIIKDHWVQGDQDKVMNEIKMLEVMHGIPGVPKLMDYWMVKRSDGKVNRMKEYHHPDVADAVSILSTYHTHIHLIMEPCADLHQTGLVHGRPILSHESYTLKYHYETLFPFI